MSNRVTRTLPALGAAAAIGLGGTVTGALAHGDHHHPTGHGHHADRGHHGDHRYSVADEQYLQTAIEGDRFEIEGGKLAQERGTTQGVKDYGARLVKDHTKSLRDATDLAGKLGIDVPKAPSPSEQWELQAIGRLSGQEFDAQYADLEAKDHQQDISEATDEADKGRNDLIRQAAKNEIPTLQEHLKIAKDLGGQEGTDPLG